MMPRLLQLCTCLEPTAGVYQEMVREVNNVDDWETIITLAESNGIAPLLANHLKKCDTKIPASVRLSLCLLEKRHIEHNKLILSELVQIISLLHEHKIRFLALKGAALANILYPTPGLRPMRDIDILIAPESIFEAKELLMKAGYRGESAENDDPKDHHMPPLTKKVGKKCLEIELHRRLFTRKSGGMNKIKFDLLYDRAISFTVADEAGMKVEAKTLGHMDMLYHIFFHALHAPLGDESFRLINITDIMGYITRFSDELDWHTTQRKWSDLFAALQFLGYLSPWPAKVQKKITYRYNHPPRDVGEIYTGWPWKPRQRFRNQKIVNIFRETFNPPEWWFLTYYVPRNVYFKYWYLLFVHPMNVARVTCVKCYINLSRGKLIDKIREFV